MNWLKRQWLRLCKHIFIAGRRAIRAECRHDMLKLPIAECRNNAWVCAQCGYTKIDPSDALRLIYDHAIIDAAYEGNALLDVLPKSTTFSGSKPA